MIRRPSPSGPNVRYTTRVPSGASDGNPLLLGPLVSSRKPVPSAMIVAICAPPSTRSARPRKTSWKPLKNARNEPMPNTIASPVADHCGPSTLRVASWKMVVTFCVSASTTNR